MKDKRKSAEVNIILESERDADILILNKISSKLQKLQGSQLVLTGSYAIEALTGSKTYHEDIDANIYTADTNMLLPKVALEMELLPELQLYKKTTDRLEYDLLPNLNRMSLKKLEFQFNSLVNNKEVPTVFAPLVDSKGKEFLFRVKSLPYVIATWSIRISGLATNPKRLLKDSDLDQFKLLLLCEYNKGEVIQAMRNHPQMPSGLDENSIFDQSINILELR